ncbi:MULTISPECIES: ankyrin repeat domain-containing protein [unclassified Roseateles]|uniref:ankyrin repeat domain-containing protein n=1 Tax=unclassified Roseateles TaxID=2626991 RepID=UPI0006F47D77|nr:MULTISPECIES: ankyrin repeat domain-containing protein [unclassified Roseateles]KQW51488.1 hypothetical protein ASC81_02275 [Pelomonas sp. Root405]KRA77721.1 hypothetical protein ASD88_02275 [Pelomonas sp. Root662]
MTDDERFARIADGRTDLVFELMAAGHPASATDRDGVSLITWCAYYGDVSGLRHLLTGGETLTALGDDLGLGVAAFHGHWRLCQFLTEQGADVNQAQADTGETPLHMAVCKANRPDYDHVVEVLLAHGADPNRATTPGVETSCFMRDTRTRGETPLHRAAAFCSAETIERLIAHGARIDAQDAHGDSPLSWASWHLRPDALLRRLCHGRFSISPSRHSTYDHGEGWEVMGVGRPHV